MGMCDLEIRLYEFNILIEDHLDDVLFDLVNQNRIGAQ
jgi:hypothetical protein